MKYFLCSIVFLGAFTSKGQCVEENIGGSFGGAHGAWAQGFTPSCSGVIDSVGFYGINSGVVPADTLYIYEGNGISGTLLHQQAFDSIFVANYGEWVSIELNTAIVANSGSQYTFAFDPGTVVVPLNAPYSGGDAFINGTNTGMATDFKVTIQPVVGLQDVNSGFSVQPYPNPTAGKLTIALGNTFQNVNIKQVNLLGQVVKEETYKSTDRIETFVEGAPGVYQFEIYIDNERKVTLSVLKE